MILSTEILQFCKKHELDNISELALKATKYPEIDMPQVLQQIKGLQVAKYKLPSWYQCYDIVYPPQISLEQCSSEATALYKQSICTVGNIMVDLTGGLGVDTSYLSRNFKKTIYVEQSDNLTNLVKYNFFVLGRHNIDVVNSDAVVYLSQMQSVDMIYIDPARRDITGRKTTLIEDCTPNLLEIQHLLDTKAKKVLIKLSPMLDISLALKSLTNVSEVHIISVDNECKELLFVKEKNLSSLEPIMNCIDIKGPEINRFRFYKKEENVFTEYTSSLNKYLYEPNASLMKAGAYKILCNRYDVKKLHPSSHLYTSNTLIKDFPGRRFEILSVSSLNKKDIRKHFSDIKQANVAIRNFPLKVDELRKRLYLKDGGDIFIFGTTLFEKKKVLIICKKS